MKNLSSFEAFRLNKVQMGAVKGGSRKCHVTYNDALGGTFDVTIEQNVSIADAEKTLKAQHPDANAVVCK